MEKEFMENANQKFNNYDEQFKKCDKQFEEIRQDLAEIKRSVLFMEEYMTSKIPALFDAYLSHEQKNEEFDNRITNLEKNSDVNSLKISILEDTSKKHSAQLAKLSS